MYVVNAILTYSYRILVLFIMYFDKLGLANDQLHKPVETSFCYENLLLRI